MWSVSSLGWGILQLKLRLRFLQQYTDCYPNGQILESLIPLHVKVIEQVEVHLGLPKSSSNSQVDSNPPPCPQPLHPQGWALHDHMHLIGKDIWRAEWAPLGLGGFSRPCSPIPNPATPSPNLASILQALFSWM